VSRGPLPALDGSIRWMMCRCIRQDITSRSVAVTCWSGSAEAKPPFSATFSQYLKRAPCTPAVERCRGAFDHGARTLWQAAEQADRVQQHVLAATAAFLRSTWRDGQSPVVQAVIDALQVCCLAQCACCVISSSNAPNTTMCACWHADFIGQLVHVPCTQRVQDMIDTGTAGTSLSSQSIAELRTLSARMLQALVTCPNKTIQC